MEDVFMAALERMMALEQAMSWLNRAVVSPPTWPDGADTSSVAKLNQAAIASHALTAQTPPSQLVGALSQVERAVNTQVSQQQLVTNTNQNIHQRTQQVAQPSRANQQTWNGGAVHQRHTQVGQVNQQSQSSWWAMEPSVSQPLMVPSSLHQQTKPTAQVKETTVTLSPTVYLQATVHEQADLDALVAKLNRLLEEEIAISAERAYT